MFDWFKKRQLQKRIEKKYGRRVSSTDFRITQSYLSNYHRNRFLSDSNLNILLFIDHYGFIEEIDNGNGEKLLVNKDFQRTEEFRSDYYYIDYKYAINNMDKDIQDTTIETYSLPLQMSSSNDSYSGGSYSSFSSSSSSYSSSDYSSSSSSWD